VGNDIDGITFLHRTSWTKGPGNSLSENRKGRNEQHEATEILGTDVGGGRGLVRTETVGAATATGGDGRRGGREESVGGVQMPL
jgi:hypothetical protein